MGDSQTVYYVLFAAVGLYTTIALAGVGWLIAGRARSEQNQRDDLRTLWVELSAMKDKLHAHELHVRDRYTPLARHMEADRKLTEAIQQLTAVVNALNVNFARAGFIKDADIPQVSN